MVRDRIVFGIRDANVKDKLLGNINLAVDKAEQICKMTEVTKMELQEMTTSSEIHMLKMNGKIGKNKNIIKGN